MRGCAAIFSSSLNQFLFEVFMNFNKITLATGLMLSGITVSGIFPPAQPFTFSDNFNSENGGVGQLNYSGAYQIG